MPHLLLGAHIWEGELIQIQITMYSSKLSGGGMGGPGDVLSPDVLPVVSHHHQNHQLGRLHHGIGRGDG